jgi:hypothetical protein
MKRQPGFEKLSREERIALCREVMENLSELVEGSAPPDFCERVEDLMGDCQPYQAYRDTLKATLHLLRECGDSPACLSAAAAEKIASGVAKASAAVAARRKKDGA